MAVLPSSGALSINDIAGVMGGTAPHSLSEYYRGGGLVPSTKTVTVTEGPYGTFTPDWYWTWSPDNVVVFIYWNGSLVYNDTPPFGTTSVTIGGYTYYRGSVFSQATTEFGTDYWSYVSRTSSTTVNINGSVPTSGQISISNFYSAEKP